MIPRRKAVSWYWVLGVLSLFWKEGSTLLLGSQSLRLGSGAFPGLPLADQHPTCLIVWLVVQAYLFLCI